MTKEVEESFSKFEPPFTFGNTQKLINMCMKYMFIMTYKDEEMRAKFVSCHCPMDGVIVESVIDLINEGGFEKDILGIYHGQGKRGKAWRGCLREPWSKIKEDKTQYEFFQSIVRFLCDKESPKISPLEFDFIYWSGDRQTGDSDE